MYICNYLTQLKIAVPNVSMKTIKSATSFSSIGFLCVVFISISASWRILFLRVTMVSNVSFISCSCLLFLLSCYLLFIISSFLFLVYYLLFLVSCFLFIVNHRDIVCIRFLFRPARPVSSNPNYNLRKQQKQ